MRNDSQQHKFSCTMDFTNSKRIRRHYSDLMELPHKLIDFSQGELKTVSRY